MTLLLKFAVSLLPTLAAGAWPPERPPPGCEAKARSVTFEDLAPEPGHNLNILPTPYQGLDYQGFDLTTAIETEHGAGIIPQSGKNYIGTNNQTAQAGGIPMLSVHYDNSTVDSFGLDSFYFGCVKYLATGAAIPVACNIQIAAYHAPMNSPYHGGAKRVCNQIWQYKPHSKEVASALLFSGDRILPCWKEALQLAVFTATPVGDLYAAPGAKGEDLALVLDDLKYSTYSCKKEPKACGGRR